MKKNKLNFSNFIVLIVLAIFLGWLFSSGLSTTETITLFGTKLEVLNINKPFQITNTVTEFLTLLLATLAIYYNILREKYEKSKKSIKFICKIFIKILYIEVVIFSFIFGTNLNNVIKKENYMFDKVLIILAIGVLIILLFSQLYLDYHIKDPIIEEDIHKYEIFESRKKDFPILDGFLKINKGTSITGRWGSGKTFFIKYFLENSEFKGVYEYIYIDTSLFLENKSLINNINIQLDDILISNKIIPQKNLIIESLFYQPEGWLKSICKYFFQKESYLDEKKELSIKIRELIPKKIVIILDNLERLESKKKIQNILSIVEEVLPVEIPRIYLYDLEKLKNLFKKEKSNNIGVEEYFEKYTDFTVVLSEIDNKEIIKEFKFSEEIKKIYEETMERLNNLLVDYLYEKDEKKENSKIIEDIKAIEEIILLLKNPRLVKQCYAIIKNESIDYSEKIKFYFAILTVIFSKKIYINQKILNENNNRPIKDIKNINERMIFEIMFNTGSVVDTMDNFGYIKDLLNKKWKRDLSVSEKMIKNIEDKIKENFSKPKVLKINILLAYIGNLIKLEKNSSIIKEKIEKLLKNEAKDIIFIVENGLDTDSNEFYNYILELDVEYLKNIQLIEKVEVSVSYGDNIISGEEYKDLIINNYFLKKFEEMRKLVLSQVDVETYLSIFFNGLTVLISRKQNTKAYPTNFNDNILKIIEKIENLDLPKKIDSVNDFFEYLKKIDVRSIEGINAQILDDEFKKYDKIKNLKIAEEGEVSQEEEANNINKNIAKLKDYLNDHIGNMIFVNFKEVPGELNKLRIANNFSIAKNRFDITFTIDDIPKIVEQWKPGNSSESDAKKLILIELNKRKNKMEKTNE